MILRMTIAVANKNKTWDYIEKDIDVPNGTDAEINDKLMDLIHDPNNEFIHICGTTVIGGEENA